MAMTTVPLVYDLQVTRQRCGPHQGTSMKSALVAAIDNQKWVLHNSAHRVVCDTDILSTYGQASLLVASAACVSQTQGSRSDKV